MKTYLILLVSIITFSCSVQRQIGKSAKADVLDAKALQRAHVGLSIFEPATNKYWFNYQGDKYFVPASNIKIPTCYAAMKYLGDSLVGLRYVQGTKDLIFQATGDPTFLHPDFKTQKVYDLLNKHNGNLLWVQNNYSAKHLGSGWSWNDYNEYYMAERSSLPMYGNVVKISGQLKQLQVVPRFFKPLIRSLIDLNKDLYPSAINRRMQENEFLIYQGNERNRVVEVPFTYSTLGAGLSFNLLRDTLGENIKEIVSAGFLQLRDDPTTKTLYSQRTDSLLKPMMHRSDNFFAEQCLLMVGNELIHEMNDVQIIDTLLKTDFKDLPQNPRWADGSGLSRYNLFTPQDFVFILNKMKNEFGMERLKVILPTGGRGTISSYYKADSNYIFGKTGTLSGVVAFSGFLYTKKGKLLIFSTLVNNHQASATDVRRAIEKFLQGLRNRY